MRVLAYCVVIALVAAPVSLGAQSTGAKQQAQPKEKRREARPPREAAVLFRDEEPLTLTMTVNFGQLKRDKRDDAPWHAASFTLASSDGAPRVVPSRVRTRGNWRLKHCELPPLRVDFEKENVKDSPFAQVNRPKLVSPCNNKDASERLLLQEYQLYRVYNLLTPLSFRARLAKLSIVDSATGKAVATRWSFFTEDADELTQRTGLLPVEQKGAGPGDMQGDGMAMFGLFQYLTGNTDFSIGALHNVQLVRDDTAYYPVPYDFDWAGAVNAPYAKPDPKLGIRNVRERLYRGYCTKPASVQRAATLFLERKEAVYALYSDAQGQLLDAETRKETLAYFDAFYREIADPDRLKMAVIDACLGRTA
jgi:hypothetical protein